MATRVGTYDISTLMAVRYQSVAEFGVDTIVQVLQRDIETHNQLVQQMVSEFCEITTDRQRIYGTSMVGEMYEVDEWGRAPTQKIATGATVGFPLSSFQYSLGWTDKWMKIHTPSDLAQMVLSSQKAHLQRIQKSIKQAIFGSTNYTFNDFLVDKVDLAVKRFINADSSQIPEGPNGETFDGSSHTHFTYGTPLSTTNATALITNVVEHGHGADVRVYINTAQEAAWRALTGFTAYQDPRIIFGATDHLGERLDITRLDNRAIGIYGAAEIWVKPWIPSGYAFAFASGDPNKPLAFRQREQTSLQGLQIAATNTAFPLTAQYMEAEFGVGVWTRTNGACMQTAGSWTDPTF